MRDCEALIARGEAQDEPLGAAEIEATPRALEPALEGESDGAIEPQMPLNCRSWRPRMGRRTPWRRGPGTAIGSRRSSGLRRPFGGRGHSGRGRPPAGSGLFWPCVCGSTNPAERCFDFQCPAEGANQRDQATGHGPDWCAFMIPGGVALGLGSVLMIAGGLRWFVLARTGSRRRDKRDAPVRQPGHGARVHPPVLRRAPGAPVRPFASGCDLDRAAQVVAAGRGEQYFGSPRRRFGSRRQM